MADELDQKWPGPRHIQLEADGEPRAALVSVDRAGRVTAMLGGADFETEPFNLVTNRGGRGRPAGDVMHVLGVLAGLEAGLDSYDPVPGGRAAGCSDGGTSGQPNPSRDGFAEALRVSDDEPVVGVMSWVAPSGVGDLVERLGVDTTGLVSGDDACDLVLGRAPVTLMEVAEMYATIANGGRATAPRLIERIENAEGEVICWYPLDGVCGDGPEPDRSPKLDAAQSRQVAEMLEVAVFDGTGHRAMLPRPSAGKTGTSLGNRDAWFAGFSCETTTVVWVGHTATAVGG